MFNQPVSDVSIGTHCPIFILNPGLDPALVQDLCSGMAANRGGVGAELGEREWQQDT